MKFIVFCLSALATGSAPLLAPLFSTTPADRGPIITRLVQGQRDQPNPQLISELNDQLKKSLNPSYPVEDRDSLVYLASDLHDPSSLSFLIGHLAELNPGQTYYFPDLGFAGFSSKYPYAAALRGYRDGAVPAILNAVSNSKSPDFDRVAEATIEFMDSNAIFPLLDAYQNSDPGTKLPDFIAVCFATVARGDLGLRYVRDRIAATYDPVASARLHHLASQLADPRFQASMLKHRSWP